MKIIFSYLLGRRSLLFFALIILVSSISFSQVCNLSSIPTNIRNGLVAYYPFCGNANDISGNNYNGSITGGTLPYVNDRFGNASSAAQLGSGYITASSSVFNFQRSSSFTVSLWFTKETAASSGRLLSTECPEGNFRIAAGNGGVYAIQFGDYIYDTVTLNTWNHLSYTYNNRLEKIYINGVLKYSNNDASTEALNYCAPFTIGAKASAAFDRWVGKIDDLSIHNRELSACEIRQLFDATSTGIPNPGVFNFNSLSDTTRVCGTSASLNAGTGYVSYSWNNGATTQSINVTTSGVYKVTVSNSTGCTASDSTYLSLVNANIINSDSLICKNSTITLIADSVISSQLGWQLLIPSSSYDGNQISFQSGGFDPFSSKLYSVTPGRIYQFDLNNNTVQTVNATNTPSSLGHFTYDFTNNRLIGNRAGRDAVFAMSTSGGSWSNIGSGSFDAESYGNVAYWNPRNNRYGYFSGYGFFTVKNWVWENTGTGGWSNPYANNNGCTPPKRVGTQMARNADGTKLYFFSGQGSCDGNQFASSCALGSAWATDVGIYCWLRDIWELDLATYTFRNILPVNSQSISKQGSFSYDFETNTFYYFGGYVPSPTYNPNIGNVLTFTNEVFRYRVGIDNGFQQISVQGTPPPVVTLSNYNGMSYYDAKYDRIIWARKDGIWALNLQSASSNLSYVWSNNTTGTRTIVSPTQTTTYYLTVGDGVSTCRDSVTLTIPVAPTISNQSFCQGATVPSIQLASSNPLITYSWQNSNTNIGLSSNGTGNIPSFVATGVGGPTQSATITVTPKIRGCDGIDNSFSYTIFPGATANAGPDATIIAGDTYAMRATGSSGSYLWSPAIGLSNASSLNPLASPITTTTYRLRVTSNQGCVASDDMTLTVVPYCIKPLNAFTPNGDGINDLWFITNGSCLTKAKVQVFNRYGAKVFEDNNYRNNWDGTYNGKPLPDGTYYYIISFLLINDKVETRSGSVTILR